MSGKLIMKRKRADQLKTLQAEEQQECIEATAEKRHRVELEPSLAQPAESAGQAERQAEVTDAAANGILIEALQKIMELQAELEAFEHDLDEREHYPEEEEAEDAEEALLDAEVETSFAAPARRSEAEALGFAMCARETLLFLQSEGVPTESPLYKALLGKLVGPSDGLLQS